MPEITRVTGQEARLFTATANIKQAITTYYCRFQEVLGKQDKV
jgi:hypothetical protein